MEEKTKARIVRWASEGQWSAVLYIFRTSACCLFYAHKNKIQMDRTLHKEERARRLGIRSNSRSDMRG